MSTKIEIAGRPVGIGEPCFLIAEVGQAHDGSLGNAHAYIDLAAEAKVDAVKFQTHIAEAESTPAETFRVNFSHQDRTRYDYWRRMEFTPEQWRGLVEHASRSGPIFLSSAFSEAAVELLEELGVPAWKVASGEISSRPLLEKMAATKKPLLISTGMATWSDIDQAIGWARSAGASVALFACTSEYPCAPQRWGLNVLGELRSRYGCPVGFSDHSGTVAAGLAAAALGANMIEVHITFSRYCFGPDAAASLTPDELKMLVTGVRQIESALAHPRCIDRNATELAETRRLFGKSIVAARDLPAGHVLSMEDLAFKKPAIGIPAKDYRSVIGTRLRRALSKDTFLSRHDLV
ncbi:MAG TPA: N-acetylneuraminate synthase [Anaerolineae bacterium]|nr:N-acetylneuraminate synthase [Anaerolineae bacterium]